MSSRSGVVDLHSHLVPGVDDGAGTPEEALDAIGRMAEQGVTAIVTTPHVDASLIARREPFERVQRMVEKRWAEVVEAARELHPELRFGLGREIMLDTPVFDLDDPGLRLAGGPYVLVEFPRLNIPPGSADALGRIRAASFRPIVAHVERYHYDGDPRETIREWREGGAALQVNQASLLGSYGIAAEELGWRLLGRGWVDLVASDHHGRGRPRIAEAGEAVVERGSEDLWRLLSEDNPRRILAGEPLAPAPGFELSSTGPGPLRRWLRRMLGPPAPAEW